MKRMAAPSHWMLDKLSGRYTYRPRTGPHKLRECIPLAVLLRQRLKYAFTNQEVIKIVKDKEGLVKVDGKVRRDGKYPLGFMDVVSLDRTGEHFRMLWDVKGKFMPHSIDEKEASFKLCKVINKSIGPNKVPYIVTHDGRTIRYPHPDIKKNDTIKVSFSFLIIIAKPPNWRDRRYLEVRTGRRRVHHQGKLHWQDRNPLPH
jgi:small subunit ribosomal protein S4e